MILNHYLNSADSILYVIIGGNLSEERFFPRTPFPKILNSKVLGKEFEENPFSKGFSSISRVKTSVRVPPLRVPFC